MQLSKRYQEALNFAFELHREHERKGTGIPYFSHLMSVSAIAMEHGANEDEAIAALLHDAIEDQADKYGGAEKLAQEIEIKFGPRVLEIVKGCTDAEVIPKPPWRERKETYLAHICEASPSIRLVSMSDKLHNARCIVADYRLVGEALWSRFNAGKEGTLWYYRSLVTAFRSADASHALVQELDRVVSEIETLAGHKAGVPG